VPGGLAEQTAERSHAHHPIVVAACAWVAGFVAVSVVMVSFGLLLTKVSDHHGIVPWDRHVTRWLAAHRVRPLNDLTQYATYVANTEPVVAVAAVAAVLLALYRRWREIIFLVGALALELSVFLTSNSLIDRPRPDVPRLNSTPSTSSFPSGHVAAAIVLWVGLAIVVAVVTTNVVARVVSWVPVAVLPITIAFARVYRGMHNPSDVIAGALLGALALAVACFVARLWAASMQQRRPAAAGSARPSDALHPAGAR
jgi:undecaprenyl-diphosphatase